MTRSSFLRKLYKRGKIQIVEASDEIKDAYLKKSESHMESAKILLEHEKLEEAVSTVYYSMYHMVLALHFKVGIKCENHSAAIILIGEVFGLENKAIFLAKSERVDKQYYVAFTIAKEDVVELIENGEEFNAVLFDFIEKLNSAKIEEYRKKAKKIMGPVRKKADKP